MIKCCLKPYVSISLSVTNRSKYTPDLSTQSQLIVTIYIIILKLKNGTIYQ